jgi:hypothetical protein
VAYPGPFGRVPTLIFLGLVVFALAVSLWGMAVAILLVVFFAQLWLARLWHASQGRYDRLISQIRDSMDDKGAKELEQTLMAEARYPDLWWPLVLTTLAAAIVAAYRGVLFGLAFLPILLFMVYRVRKRASLVKALEAIAEKELTADVH